MSKKLETAIFALEDVVGPPEEEEEEGNEEFPESFDDESFPSNDGGYDSYDDGDIENRED